LFVTTAYHREFGDAAKSTPRRQFDELSNDAGRAAVTATHRSIGVGLRGVRQSDRRNSSPRVSGR
jgi:hypothetical protein